MLIYPVILANSIDLVLIVIAQTHSPSLILLVHAFWLVPRILLIHQHFLRTTAHIHQTRGGIRSPNRGGNEAVSELGLGLSARPEHVQVGLGTGPHAVGRVAAEVLPLNMVDPVSHDDGRLYAAHF